MRLHFPREEIDRLLLELESMKGQVVVFDSGPDTQDRAVWLCSDMGIYLMTNIAPDDLSIPKIVYAREANPNTVQSADRRKAQDAAFGRKNHMSYISASNFRQSVATFLPHEDWIVEAVPEGYSFSMPLEKQPDPNPA